MCPSPVFDYMRFYHFSYAEQGDAKNIFSLFYHAFNSKFQTMLPENPEKAFILYYEYFKKGLQKKKNRIILIRNNRKTIIGFLALEGLGVPFFSGNPSLATVAKTINIVGLRKFFRLFLGMLLIEGYPPSNEFLYINTIIIDEKYRRKGLGKKFISLAEQIAEKRHLKGICLYVDIGNLPAMRFYEKLNFKKESGFGGDFLRKSIGVKYYSYQYKILLQS